MEENENTVFIGKKDVMSYVLAVITQFNKGNSDVIIKARGRAISRAVDVAEIVRQRFVKDIKAKDIRISTESVEGKDGPLNVSAIEITVSKG